MSVPDEDEGEDEEGVEGLGFKAQARSCLLGGRWYCTCTALTSPIEPDSIICFICSATTGRRGGVRGERGAG